MVVLVGNVFMTLVSKFLMKQAVHGHVEWLCMCISNQAHGKAEQSSKRNEV